MATIYVHLSSSDATPVRGDGNVISSFTTLLAQELHFDEDFECALSEISYPLSWTNLPEPAAIALSRGDVTKVAHVRAGNYDTQQDLIAAVNRTAQLLAADEFRLPAVTARTLVPQLILHSESLLVRQTTTAAAAASAAAALPAPKTTVIATPAAAEPLSSNAMKEPVAAAEAASSEAPNTTTAADNTSQTQPPELEAGSDLELSQAGDEGGDEGGGGGNAAGSDYDQGLRSFVDALNRNAEAQGELRAERERIMERLDADVGDPRPKSLSGSGEPTTDELMDWRTRRAQRFRDWSRRQEPQKPPARSARAAPVEQSPLLLRLDDALRGLLGASASPQPIPPDATYKGLCKKTAGDDSQNQTICALGIKGMKGDPIPEYGDIAAGLHAILVYSDAIRAVNVGPLRAPVLKIVHVESSSHRNQAQVCQTYSVLEFKPLLTRSLRQITITLYDDAGRIVDFRVGSVRLTLALRPVAAHG